MPLMRKMLAALLMFYCSSLMSAQCGFLVDPAAAINWHRSEGWPLPGVNDGKITRHVEVTFNGKPPDWPTGPETTLVREVRLARAMAAVLVQTRVCRIEARAGRKPC